MPKRATLTYTSEDAPTPEIEQLRVYYCKYSGKNAFITDCKIERLPRRKTDNASVLDTEKHMVKLYTTDGGVKLIRRRNGSVERQYRFNVDSLPVAYKFAFLSSEEEMSVCRSEMNGRYLYIMDEAVAEFTSHHQVQATGTTPVPPCITPIEDGDGCQVTLEIEDKESKSLILKISADAVKISIMNSVSHDQANNEILKLFSKILGCRASQLSINKGATTKHKLLAIQNIESKQTYDKLLDLGKL